MPVPPSLRDLLALHLVEGLGPARITALIDHFGSAARARQATAGELVRITGFGDQLSASVGKALPAVDVDAEIARLDKAGVEVLALGQDGYPPALATIPGAPLLLFAQGRILPADARAVALVGTRHPDAYGKKVTKQLAGDLARAGVVVVSGLARGIDGLAHQAALDAGGRTLAVLAGGLASIYPPEHRDLARRVTDAGALITEGTMLTEPTKWRFPARNRIISGLSGVVVIVQAPADSGALITAEHAADQGRTVLAVPGPIDGKEHAGCHRLIREGAALCRSVEDILEELDGVSAVATAAKQRVEVEKPAPPAEPPALDDQQRRVWECLADGPRGGDELARLSGLNVGQLASVLLGLEMRKVIRRLPGNRYERV